MILGSHVLLQYNNIFVNTCRTQNCTTVKTINMNNVSSVVSLLLIINIKIYFCSNC